MLLLNHHFFVYGNKNEVLQIYCNCSGFFFLLLLKGKILKKLVVALKFLTVLTLNCNIFC